MACSLIARRHWPSRSRYIFSAARARNAKIQLTLWVHCRLSLRLHCKINAKQVGESQLCGLSGLLHVRLLLTQHL
ncbi:MAG: hypothetical protein ACI82I_000595, partial [Gammaproteobacteria bacterium]